MQRVLAGGGADVTGGCLRTDACRYALSVPLHAAAQGGSVPAFALLLPRVNAAGRLSLQIYGPSAAQQLAPASA
jgi:hypothetical protein